MEIIRNLYQICGYPFGVHANIHAAVYSKGIVLFDCGTNEMEAKLAQRNLSYWGLDGLPITHVFVTHVHQDHGGNSKYFQDQGATIYAGPGDAENIEHGTAQTIDYALTEKAVPCPGIHTVHDEDVIQIEELSVRCIHIPGHSPGSMLYHIVLDGQDVCFGGDSIRCGTNAKDAILGWTGGLDYDRDQYIKTLRRLCDMVRHGALKCDVLCGGHFQPMIGNAYKLVYWAYRDACENLRECKNLI